jgi:multidrug efflux pump subunit AcrB
VPLAAVSEIAEVEGPLIRKHYEFKRAITITAEVDVTKVTSAELNQRIRAFYKQEASKYPAVTAIFGGEEESTNESLASLGFALLLALIGIFATLVFTFRSFTKPVLILSSIPLGLIGVFYSFAIDQRPLSFIAFIGVVGLTGVVINSAIILVDYIEELRRELGEQRSLQDILVLASGRRLRAVLATGLTTVVGLIPAAFSLGGYDPILVPITLALSWGMIIGTVLALIWIPVGYLVLEDIRSFLLRLFRVGPRSTAT